MRAVVWEAADGPQPKVGESVPPSANPVLERLGLLAGMRRSGAPSHGNRSAWGSAVAAERDFVFGPEGVGWRLDRRAFEAELAAAAIGAGVDWRYDHRLVGCTATTGGWRLTAMTTDGPRTLSADTVVDASGRSARLARLLGARRIRHDHLVGAVAYPSLRAGLGSTQPDGGSGSAALDSTTLVEAVSDGWWYSLVLPGDRLAVAFLTDADLLDRSAVRSSAHLDALLQHAPLTRERVSAAGSAALPTAQLRPAHTSRLTAVIGPRWLAVGEAAIAFDPLASYGITAALGAGFYAGAAVADALAGDRQAFHLYARLVDRTFAQYLVMLHDRYAVERRWPTSPFWRRRQQTSPAAPPAES